MLGELGAKTASTSRLKSRSVIKAKLAVLEMQPNTKKSGIDDILADILKGDRNIDPTASKYSILCPSFGLANCIKTFCVANNWWDLRPRNSERTSNHISVHWYNNFKGLYDNRKIPHLLLKMADNQLHILYSHPILKHGRNHYPLFDYDENNWRSNRIKAYASVREKRHARQLAEINSDTKARRDAGNKSETDMSVLRVIF